MYSGVSSYGFSLIPEFLNPRDSRQVVLRLDYISCVLTVLSTILIGRRLWHGWIIAAANSAIICIIGLRTQQTGFIPANLFCLAIYAYNVMQWKSNDAEAVSSSSRVSDTLTAIPKHVSRARAKSNGDSLRHRDRVRQRRLRRGRKSYAALRPEPERQSS